MRNIISGLAGLGDDRTLGQEIDRAEKFGSDMTETQAAYAEISQSDETDFDRRLAASTAGKAMAAAGGVRIGETVAETADDDVEGAAISDKQYFKQG